MKLVTVKLCAECQEIKVTIGGKDVCLFCDEICDLCDGYEYVTDFDYDDNSHSWIDGGSKPCPNCNHYED